MRGDWMTMRVELVAGLGQDHDPGLGRLLLVGPSHTFADLHEAIETAFARWDRSHLHQFTLADGRLVGVPDPDEDEPGQAPMDERTLTVVGSLAEGDRLLYEFDFGDRWLHDCRVDGMGVDPLRLAGIRPRQIIPVWGWGVLPDQYDRRWDGDDGERDLPPGHEADDHQVAFRTGGVDVRIVGERTAGDHMAEARPAPAGNGRSGKPATGRSTTGRLAQADSDFAAVEFPDPPAWLAALADDPGPCRPRTINRHGTAVWVSVPLPFRREVLLPWLERHDHTMAR